MARRNWLRRMDAALLLLFGTSQRGNAEEDARLARERAASPVPAKDLVPGGWVRRGTPGHYYIVRATDPSTKPR